MYKLRALGDLHIVNVVKYLLRDCVIEKSERAAAHARFADMIIRNPKLLASKHFAEFCADYLSRQNSSHRTCSLSIGQDCRQLADIAREQFAEFSKGHGHIYTEGTDNIFGLWAERQGIGVTYLDRNNPYWGALHNASNNGHGESHNLQYLREGIWISRIEASKLLENSLLFAGTAHVENYYGLIDRLRNKGIEVDVLPQLESIKKYQDSRPKLAAN